MTGPLGYRLAEIQPCLFPDACEPGDEPDSRLCSGCQGDGTRVVVTDTELEPAPKIGEPWWRVCEEPLFRVKEGGRG